jgi:hypothetical protein
LSYFDRGSEVTIYAAGLPTQNGVVVQRLNGVLEMELLGGDHVAFHPYSGGVEYVGTATPGIARLAPGVKYSTTLGGTKDRTFVSWDGNALEWLDASGAPQFGWMTGIMFF